MLASFLSKREEFLRILLACQAKNGNEFESMGKTFMKTEAETAHRKLFPVEGEDEEEKVEEVLEEDEDLLASDPEEMEFVE